MSGDGLVGQVGGALAETGTPMGILPGGRGNDLARVLSIPSEPAGAVAVLADGHERQIDVGEANDRRFLCVASCGFDSDANRIANEARLVGATWSTPTPPSVPCRLAPGTVHRGLDGGDPIDFDGYSVAVATAAPSAEACSSPRTQSSTTAGST